MPDNPIFEIRPMVRDDLEQAFSLSVNEGWNQTEKDWRLLLENPANTCIVAEKDDRIAGTATALNHSGKIAWIGMVLVDKSVREQGAGKMLLTHILTKLKQVQSIKLDATPAGQPLYQKLGFLEEHKIIRMTGSTLNNIDKITFSTVPVNIDQKILSEVIKIDKRIFGVDRSYLLKKLHEDYPGKAFCLKLNNKSEGYILGRDGTRFNYIGPVNAYSTDSAKILIAKALESLNNQPVAIDVLSDKEDLIAWLESIGFVKERYFIRMYLNSNPYPGLVSHQYLISGPEFG